MNYGKLQLSFILLLIMTLILALTCFFLVHSLLLTLTSVSASVFCIIGLVYSFHQENLSQKQHKK